MATAQDKQGLTVLHYAALGGEPDVVEFLISEFGDSATIRNYNGGLPIHFAAGAGNTSFVNNNINLPLIGTRIREILVKEYKVNPPSLYKCMQVTPVNTNSG